jgi:hypothetical protein
MVNKTVNTIEEQENHASKPAVRASPPNIPTFRRCRARRSRCQTGKSNPISRPSGPCAVAASRLTAHVEIRVRQEFRAALGRLDTGIHTTEYLPIGGNGDWERTDCGLEDALDQRPVPARATEFGDGEVLGSGGISSECASTTSCAGPCLISTAVPARGADLRSRKAADRGIARRQATAKQRGDRADARLPGARKQEQNPNSTVRS